jgi:hypothetical protein
MNKPLLTALPTETLSEIIGRLHSFSDIKNIQLTSKGLCHFAFFSRQLYIKLSKNMTNKSFVAFHSLTTLPFLEQC